MGDGRQTIEFLHQTHLWPTSAFQAAAGGSGGHCSSPGTSQEDAECRLIGENLGELQQSFHLRAGLSSHVANKACGLFHGFFGHNSDLSVCLWSRQLCYGMINGELLRTIT